MEIFILVGVVFICFIIAFSLGMTLAQIRSKRDGVELSIRCNTTTGNRFLAYKKDNQWHGLTGYEEFKNLEEFTAINITLMSDAVEEHCEKIKELEKNLPKPKKVTKKVKKVK